MIFLFKIFILLIMSFFIIIIESRSCYIHNIHTHIHMKIKCHIACDIKLIEKRDIVFILKKKKFE